MKKSNGLIIIILLVSVMAAGCSSSDGSGVQDVKKSEVGSGENNAPTEQITPVVKGGYENPASLGEIVVLTSTSNTYEVSILETIRGEKANYLVKSANQFNDVPAPGDEYLFVKTKVVYTEGKDPTNVNYLHFKVYSNGTEIPQPSVVYPNEYKKFDTGNLMPGATKEGWIIFTVPQGNTAVIAFQPNMFDENTAYLSIE